jgi:hypothetical protein
MEAVDRGEEEPLALWSHGRRPTAEVQPLLVERLAKNHRQLVARQRREAELVGFARAEGLSWARIAAAIGVTRSSARERYGP